MVKMTMRKTFLGVAALGLIALGACSTDPVAPNDLLLEETIGELVPDYAISSAAVMDGAGIGGARLPDSLQLTADQKAAIAELHDAFKKAHQDEVETLRNIEKQIHDIRRNGGSREQVQALIEQARPILQGLADDFAKLQEAVWAIYTPEQRAWIESHKPKVCDRNPPQLTAEQIAKIRALKEAFEASVADELAAIKAAHDAARQAKQAGKSAEEIRAILASVQDEMEAVRTAEKRLEQAILDVLTPEQRARWCIVRQHVAPGPRRP